MVCDESAEAEFGVGWVVVLEVDGGEIEEGVGVVGVEGEGLVEDGAGLGPVAGLVRGGGEGGEGAEFVGSRAGGAGGEGLTEEGGGLGVGAVGHIERGYVEEGYGVMGVFLQAMLHPGTEDGGLGGRRCRPARRGGGPGARGGPSRRRSGCRR